MIPTSVLLIPFYTIQFLMVTYNLKTFQLENDKHKLNIRTMLFNTKLLLLFNKITVCF